MLVPWRVSSIEHQEVMKDSEDPKSQVLSNQKAASAMEPWIDSRLLRPGQGSWPGVLVGLRFFFGGMTSPTLRDGKKNYYEESLLSNDFHGNVRCFIDVVSGWMNSPSARISATNTKNLRSNPPQTVV